MTVLVCEKAFRLNTLEGMKFYDVGDKVEGAAADHWYAKAHCKTDEVSTAAEAAILDATKDIIQSLVTEDKPVPNVGDINAKLAEAKLPKITADKRDEILKG